MKFKILLIISVLSLILVGVAHATDYGLKATVDATQGSLPTSIKGATTLAGLAGVIVKTGLSLIGIVFLGLMLYAGIVWMKSMGASEDVERAKEIIQSSIIGLIIVSAAYAITSFVFTNLASDGGSGSGGGDKCSAQFKDGVCIPVSQCGVCGPDNQDQCKVPKQATPGLCPGAANIQCCHS